ncbi:MAG: hypothetical protein AAF585_23135 [Verrucomicrobiota bacterium]
MNSAAIRRFEDRSLDGPSSAIPIAEFQRDQFVLANDPNILLIALGGT